MIDEEEYYSRGKFQKDGWGDEGESEILRENLLKVPSGEFRSA